MRPRIVCALCGESRRTTLFEKNDYPIAKCGACGFVQVDVEPSRAELEELYGEAYFAGDVFHRYLAERDIRVESGAVHARTLAKIVPGGRLLDVGCAAGFFLEAAARHYDVAGVELSPFASDYARRELGLRVLTGDVTEGAFEGEQFDVVTLWNTIEHLVDPPRAVQAISSLTKPGALLVLSTGDVAGPLARRDLGGWNLMSPPHHLFFFSPRTLDLMLARAGFRLRRIVYDGVVAERGPLASSAARQVAVVLGIGNVMTAYARRMSESPRPSSARELLTARYRPLGRV